MRRHTSQPQGDQTSTQRHVSLCSRLRTYGPHAQWEQLTLTQQLNCVCDTLAKRSVTTAINHGYHDRPTQLLPKEDVALVLWGNKITGDISPPLRFHASKEVARRYLASRPRDKWSNDRFDAVDWEYLDLALKIKSDMYDMAVKTAFRLLRHQGTGGTVLGHERCPNCGRRETAAHLMLCPDDSRTKLLVENVDDLTTWMS
jgi:hypothetical protein